MNSAVCVCQDDTIGENKILEALRWTLSRTFGIWSYPRFDSLEEERLYRKQHVATASRILTALGFDEEVAGQISVRDSVLTGHF